MSIPLIVCSVLSFIPAIVLHEMGHAFAAFKLGDPTAESRGRLSFNPVRHIDPFGTLILPGLLIAMGMPVFGYAKPVPYNPAYFKDPRRDDLIVGLAGPAANLAQALLAGGVAALIYLYAPLGQLLNDQLFSYFFTLFLPLYALINLNLMFFNLLPIPPLDGSSIFAVLIPERLLPRYYQIQGYAFPILIGVIVLGPRVLGFDPFGLYLDATAHNLWGLLFPYLR
ncbi:site-2 protease family protein [Eggerthellaceae bacterium zg-1084]|uniref:Site-2 protease family protein n=1 Tax=Berryella wangjianweii TaxID=2734634 RepID=A0A6M8J254_9ACTN|nr:site-2 protease family protein [Berryella wangjianweii]NPD31221.1 site-2 protease family protein [Berryella wangjianweii]NPD32470.1 site-2 protease family protein [Eggerthellaceae bacterium zg-997]QKF06773.1 site-2 protease family protein [Berryella wangjianweii]